MATRIEKNGEALSGVSNAAAEDIEALAPYVASVTIKGVAPILFHAWDVDAVEEKSKAAKGSKTKKTDNVESYVYRDEKGYICLPGKYLVGSVTDRKKGAARYRQDPRSPRKMATDLYQAGVIPLTILAPIATVSGQKAKTWDYLDRQRVVVQQSAITRTRPAFLEGWTATVDIQVLLPDYIPPSVLLSVIEDAGRFVGVGDYRPTYGRFQVVKFEVGLA